MNVSDDISNKNTVIMPPPPKPKVKSKPKPKAKDKPAMQVALQDYNAPPSGADPPEKGRQASRRPSQASSTSRSSRKPRLTDNILSSPASNFESETSIPDMSSPENTGRRQGLSDASESLWASYMADKVREVAAKRTEDSSNDAAPSTHQPRRRSHVDTFGGPDDEAFSLSWSTGIRSSTLDAYPRSPAGVEAVMRAQNMLEGRPAASPSGIARGYPPAAGNKKKEEAKRVPATPASAPPAPFVLVPAVSAPTIPAPAKRTPAKRRPAKQASAKLAPAKPTPTKLAPASARSLPAEPGLARTETDTPAGANSEPATPEAVEATHKAKTSRARKAAGHQVRFALPEECYLQRLLPNEILQADSSIG